MADDLMTGYRRIVSLAPQVGADMQGVPDRRCHRPGCASAAYWRVGRRALCDRHGRAAVTKIRKKAKK